ncbi:hypothetical protein H489_0109885 [Curtobacterium flaccumfaciens UCD-AKU]|nr:hypothetical protein H489_0109885 [Curtobacterium flaccumfaciens UCD-AKU]
MTTPRTGQVSPAEADRRVDFADAALGAAGHQVTDPILREYSRRVAEGTMTAEDAIAAGMAHLDAR